MNYWYRGRHRVYTILVGLLLLDAVVYVSWLRRAPLAPAVAAALQAQLERDVQAREAEVARLRRVREKLPEIRPALASFLSERFPPEQAGYSAVAVALNEAARAAGVRLENLSFKVQTRRGQAELVGVEVGAELEGGYATLLRCLESLEKAPGFYLIDELGVVSSQRGGLRLQLRLVTYFRRSS